VNLFRLGAGEKVVGMDRMAEPSGDDDEESNETEISPED
jgi:hypothetical protein